MTKKIGKFFCIINRFKGLYMLLILITALTTMVNFLLPYLNGKIIDTITNQEYYHMISFIKVLAILYLVNTFISFYETYLSSYLKNSFTSSIKKDLFEKFLNLPMRELNEVSVGEIISKIEFDALTLSDFFVTDIIDITAIKIANSFLLLGSFM